MKLKDALSIPKQLHIAFDRDDAIDAEEHARLVGLMQQSHEQVYDNEDIALAQSDEQKNDNMYSDNEVASNKSVSDLADEAETTLTAIE